MNEKAPIVSLTVSPNPAHTTTQSTVTTRIPPAPAVPSRRRHPSKACNSGSDRTVGGASPAEEEEEEEAAAAGRARERSVSGYCLGSTTTASMMSSSRFTESATGGREIERRGTEGRGERDEG